MTTTEFRAWHKTMGYSSWTAGAEALGMSRSGYAKLLGGRVKIDRRTALACAAIEAGLKEWEPRAA